MNSTEQIDMPLISLGKELDVAGGYFNAFHQLQTLNFSIFIRSPYFRITKNSPGA